MNIVLYQPEIPQNTGNIARTCALTETNLHLIKPLGFSLDEKHLKRAGLDYWDLVNVNVYESFDDFIEKNPDIKLYLLTTKADKFYHEIEYDPNAFLMFGKETAGIPEEIHQAYPDNRFRIPMRNHPKARSLNLSNAVNIVLFEALRQNDFIGLI
ncbi:MAG: tRNA (uridine(34)/cytosine(34)/5-carboxymethylaminomethyluridine(34)-2'-O)-methyltransferase TrmL [Acetobacterium sp.]|nr:tRNA (uridine(34)/cytosine(34)/5-carboxymethylaminomethyluridine(34)-2'-O)-methyltransferase TrmL [uncultured Acetobacterium sp.]MBU4438627.1 tRNA (uridine(34)/cytosine(34)/5-carboxymethylaminomethyluridine(34)-2'-O)-methyltransferase TrmL [Bacillota bacterium]MCG2730325.1 tRNA (uridine(34)/cytosine(34)/5-carboxymethylaminomethyluridine(34)-2'-O)-methyltransferase TrmL [Acetobacterium sp.]